MQKTLYILGITLISLASAANPKLTQVKPDTPYILFDTPYLLFDKVNLSLNLK